MTQVEELLKQFDKQGFFDKYQFEHYYEEGLMEDAGITDQYRSMLYARSGDRFFYIRNAWELLEQNPLYVGTGKESFHILLPNETHAEVLNEQDPEYLKERQDWTEIKQAMIKLFQNPLEVKDDAQIQVQGMCHMKTINGIKFFDENEYPLKPYWEKSIEDFRKEFHQSQRQLLNPSTPEAAANLEKMLDQMKQDALKHLPPEQHEIYLKKFDEAIEKAKRGEEISPAFPDDTPIKDAK